MRYNSLESIKKKLKDYKRSQIRFNEPHFSHMLLVRDGRRSDVISNLLNPMNLKMFYTEKGRKGDWVYSLYFKISNTRTMKIPVIFDLNNKKCIYVLTYIMRYRPWQNMIRRTR